MTHLLTVPEVAEALRLDPVTIRRWIRDDRLPAVRIGSRYRIKADDVAALLDGTATS